MYKDVTDIQYKFYLIFAIEGTVCPLHAMPGYNCEHYNTGTCIYEDSCVYYPPIDDSKLLDLFLLCNKYSSTIRHMDITTREQLKDVVLEDLLNTYNMACNRPYGTLASDILIGVRKIFGQRID